MDVGKYMAKSFIKPDDVRVPQRERIVNVYPSARYDCLILDLESGDQLSLNPITTRVLGKAYGTESDHWRGHVIELSCGQYTKDGEEKDTVVVKPISLPERISANGKNAVIPGEMTVQTTEPAGFDEIPF